MAVKNIPWAVTGNDSTLHSSGLVRNATYLLGLGREGVVGDDLKVVASPSPNSNVLVKFGNGIVKNTKVDGENQSYIVAVKNDTVVTVPNNQTGSSTKTDYIIIEVLDPEHDTTLTMSSSHIFTNLRAVTSSEYSRLKTVKRPFLALAKITWRANSTQITGSMIEDLRPSIDSSRHHFYRPSLLNGFREHQPSKFGNVGYYKDNNNIVHLCGLINGGNTNFSTAFTLPEGYRPPKERIFACVAYKDGRTVLAYVGITPQGIVQPELSKVSYLSLDNISFSTVEGR